ncbi:MAG: sigma-70 family RNA polymerase sigma factor [Gemmatimonadaceae bacterium]|nr:sigma-70 family RNA polymerase sigma factor [Gemmatimonadaceae bacterium]
MSDAAHQSPITALLSDVQGGVPGAADRLARAVMADVRRLAERAMRHEAPGHTLQPTELADETLLRLLGMTQITWQNRAQFFAVAAQTIRRVLVDHARFRRRLKRDHGVRVTLDDAMAIAAGGDVDVLSLEDALVRLDTLAPRQARVVELRFFGGLDIEETARVLDLSPATVKRDWTFARAFLLRALTEDPA